MEYSHILLLFLCLLIWMPWLIQHLIKPRHKKNDLDVWLSMQPNCQQIKQAQSVFIETYQKVNGKQVSLSERARLKIESDAFVYGEIEFLSFAKILNIASPHPGDIFYDLGCGAGKAVYAAAILHDFSKAYGVEFLPGLYQLANGLREKFEYLSRSFSDIPKNNIVKFINADILNVDIDDADVVFINATCFSGKIWQNILDKLSRLKPGARAIVTTKQLGLSEYELIYEQLELMSWGLCTARIYRKLR